MRVTNDAPNGARKRGSENKMRIGNRSWVAAFMILLPGACSLQAQTPASSNAPVRVTITQEDLLAGGEQIKTDGTLLQATRFGNNTEDITAFGVKWSKWPGSPAAKFHRDWGGGAGAGTVDVNGDTFTGAGGDLVKWVLGLNYGWITGTFCDLKPGKRYRAQFIANSTGGNREMVITAAGASTGNLRGYKKPLVVTFEWTASQTNEAWGVGGPDDQAAVGFALFQLPDVVKLPMSAEVKSLAVIPAPRSCKLTGGNMALTAKSRIVAGKPELMLLAKILAWEIKQLVGLELEATEKPAGAGDIELAIDSGMKDEAYGVDVGKKAIVKAGNPAAVALGSVTLLQSLSARDGGVALPRMSVQDAPAVGYRGLMIDCVRQPHSINVLKQLVVLCRWHKIRYLQLHLTDSEAFTFPSTAYPPLATKDRHYSIEELRDLEVFARDRGVTIIPEIDVPGHAKVMVQALPQVFATSAGGYEISVGREETYKALDTIVGEMCDVFRNTPYFHIGADEVTKGFWGDPETAAYMKAHQIDNTEELYRHFIVRMNEIVKKHNKKTIVWEGFGKDGKVEIPKDITVMGYVSLDNIAPDLIAGGYPVINASGKPLYVVNGQNFPPEYIYGWNHYRWENDWKPSKAFGKPINVAPTPQVIGAQMCAWEQPELQELPSLRHRLAAMSERIWNPDAGRTFADFKDRLRATDAGLSLVMP
ncbi:MAG: family 20 glycosylhydrolase [Planctomycetota bacterium]|nr:family 20 glycosylhydrolase [Planctomycetota bacterium]